MVLQFSASVNASNNGRLSVSLVEAQKGKGPVGDGPGPQRRSAGTVCRALVPLQKVSASLVQARAGCVPVAAERQRLLKSARRAKVAVLPSLLRALCGDSDSEAAWAHCLLRAVASGAAAEPVRGRLLKQCNRLLIQPRLGDPVKARILALLADLEAPLGEQVVLADPEGMLAQSVAELLRGLGSAAELKEAVELIFTQVPAAELQTFLDEVARHGGAQARPLFSALLADPRLPASLARHCMAQYRPSRPPPRLGAPRRSRPPRGRLLEQVLAGGRVFHC
jgi:hypothetical protein